MGNIEAINMDNLEIKDDVIEIDSNHNVSNVHDAMELNSNNASNVHDLSVCYYENGIEVVKELAKEILTKGAWATIIYQYQEWDHKLQTYGPIKFTIRRYQKQHGMYKTRSKFNISNIEQAKKIITVLSNWI